jgi:hypothetical protein
MAYPIIEQETTIVYEAETKLYTIYTTVPKHIRRIQKKASMFELLDHEVDSKGEHIALKVRGRKLPPASTFN